MTPNELIKMAQSWIGTPYHDQAKLKGVGADCIGFIVGLMDEMGIDTSSIPSNYSRHPNPEYLLKVLQESPYVRQDPENRLVSGRIVLFYMYKEPQHFGLINNDLLIHCCEGAQVGVVETPIGRWAERVHSVWVPNFIEEGE